MIRVIRWPFGKHRRRGLHPADVQGNVLQPYGLATSAHLFVHVGSAEGGRAVLRAALDDVTSGASWATKPASTLNVSFTHGGLTALGVPAAVLASFPDAFRQGMAARAELLGDTGRSAPGKWEPGLGTGQAHILFTVNAAGDDECDAAVAKLAECFAANDVTIVTEQRGRRLPDRKEHFGYCDGVGQPAIEGTGGPTRGEGDVGTFHHWHGLPVGEIFHGHIDADCYPSPGPAPPFDRDGTFKVWRKLYEDAATFRGWIAEQSAQLGIDEVLLRAKLIGRWPDASPLALTPDRPDPQMAADPNSVNAFDYSDDTAGLRCPLGAHIRRTNPRSGLGFGDALSARQRIIRRGMTYGPPMADDCTDDDGVDRGIFFVAYMADIERQYEFIQANWCNDGDAVNVGHDRDPFVGRASGDHKFTIPGATPKFVHPLPELVVTRGGEYLWVPSMRSLAILAIGSWEASMTPEPLSRRTERPGGLKSVVERVAGTALGVVLAPIAAIGSFIRGRRVVHPIGAVYDAEVVVSDPPLALLDATVLAKPGPHPAIVRLSRGFGLPLAHPDVHGLAIRLLDAGGAGRPQDLLLATVRRRRSGGDTAARTARYAPTFSSLLRLGVSQGIVVLRAFPTQPMPDDATVHSGAATGLTFELAAGVPRGDVHAWGRLTLGSPRSAEIDAGLRFSLANDGGGVRAVGTLNVARKIVYRASQFGRAASKRPA
jgi:Dyp-type peroxidase family